MDPISGIASIFAIISLAIQLGEGAIGIKTFLDSVLDAPAEVRRLKSSIALLIDINKNVSFLLDHQAYRGGVDHRVIQSIYHNLQFCEDKLNLIKAVLRRLDAAENVNPVRRGWLNIRLACNKEQFEAFADQLDLAINMLGANLAINSSHLQLTALSNIAQLSERLTDLSQTMISEKLHFSALADKPQGGLRLAHRSSAPLPLLHTKSSSPGKVREWESGKGLRLRYCHVGGEHSRYSISAIIQLYGSRVVEVRLNVTDPRKSFTPSSLISVRSLVPQDAAIINACKTGDSIGVMQLLTSRKARPNDVTLENATALSTAIKHDQHEIVQLLLQAGADPNLPAGRLQSSPIQIAVAHNNPLIARLLMRHGADLQYCSVGSWSILHYLFDRDNLSSKHEYYSMFWDDLQFDDIRDPEGWTALHRCAAFGTADDVYMLVKLGASSFTDRYITTLSRSPIHIAAYMDNVSTLQALSELSVNHHSVPDGATQQRTILETADINGWTPLHLAIYCKAMDTAKWLLDQKVDVHKKTYQTAIWFPENRKNETFSVIDLANMAGEKVLETFSSLLSDAGYDITTDGSDIYW